MRARDREETLVAVRKRRGKRSRIDVSVVLPAKNEEDTIGICIKKIQKVFKDHKLNGEIIVADNSVDKTPNIAIKMGAKVIIPDKNGYGYAYRYAFNEVTGVYIVMGDADDTYNFLEIPKLLALLDNDEADLIIGSRFKGRIQRGAMPWHHKWIGNPVLTWCLNLFFKAGISDGHSGFRAISKENLKKLTCNANGMEFASEMIIDVKKKGLRIAEVPITYYKRKNQNSKLSSFSDGWKHLKLMLLHAPNFLFIYPGVFILFFSLFIFSSLVLRFNPALSLGANAIIKGIIFFITGYQLIFFGLFATIIKRNQMPSIFSLEKGATIGSIMFLISIISQFILNNVQINSIFYYIPSLTLYLIGLISKLLGIQLIISSFMLSIIASES